MKTLNVACYKSKEAGKKRKLSTRLCQKQDRHFAIYKYEMHIYLTFQQRSGFEYLAFFQAFFFATALVTSLTAVNFSEWFQYIKFIYWSFHLHLSRVLGNNVMNSYQLACQLNVIKHCTGVVRVSTRIPVSLNFSVLFFLNCINCNLT